MKKLLLSLAAVSTIAATSNAQLRFAPVVGLDMASIKYTESGISIDFKAKPGVHLGVLAELGLAKNFYLQPGLLLSMQSSKWTIGSDATTYNPMYLQIPVNVVYRFNTPNGLFVNAGPTLSYGIGGKIKETGSSDVNFKWGSGADKNMKPMNLAFNLGAGYEMANGLFLKAQYMLGLSNQAPETTNSAKMKSNDFQISIGYFLSRRGSKK